MISTSVVFVIPTGFSRMSVSFLTAFGAFGSLTRGRSEAYGPPTVSEELRTMGPRLANNGRKQAMEAAIIPRFISSLSYLSAAIAHGYADAGTHTANTTLTRLSSEMAVRASSGECAVRNDLQVTSAE